MTSPPTTTDAGTARSASGATRALLRNEARLLRREPATVIWAVVLPLVAATVLANVPATRSPNADLGGWSFSQVYLPTLIILTASLLSVQALPALLAKYREDGILKRLRTTPASPTNLLVALFVLMGGVSAAVALLMTLIPVVSGVPFRGNGLAFGLVVVLTLVSFTALGLLFAAVSPNSRFATGIGTVAFFVLAFFAGLWIPRSLFPATLATVADWTPSGAASRAMLDSMQGDWPAVQSVFVLVLYAAVCAVVATRMFRWE
ncbi:ABC transporter permease [Humibacillus sp. DSM 29435]|uniref:ABC transporter permease n=1 Tax=Humibacillus sp. DSM 29435 TaxID=1869167 RepID=UPI0009F3B4BA|nr:ABC transporter permease [Humibacillus sp. DSM 29435]